MFENECAKFDQLHLQWGLNVFRSILIGQNAIIQEVRNKNRRKAFE